VRIRIACSSYSLQLDDYVRRSLQRVAANFRAHGHDCPDWEPDGALYVDRWRNMAAQQALDEGADAVFYHDADQTLYVDDEVDLAALLDLGPVVGAAYLSRQEPPEYVLRVHDRRGQLPRPLDAAEMCARVAPFGVYWIGAGALWVRTSTFRTVPFPWFMSGYRGDGAYIGEDVFFCEQVRAAGLHILCQPAITTGHMITGFLMHRPGVVGGLPPASCADKQEKFRTVVGDATTFYFQDARDARDAERTERAEHARLGDADDNGHRRGDRAPAVP